jgi:hypothetical protein
MRLTQKLAVTAIGLAVSATSLTPAEASTVTPGARVVLERKYDGADWKRTRITDTLDPHIRAGRSRVRPVVVYSWRDLSALAPAGSRGTGTMHGTRINRTSIVGYTGSVGRIGYDLDGRCGELDTTVGLRETSAKTATGTAYLRTDDVQQYAGSCALRESAHVSLPLTDVFRLAFSWTSTNPAGTPEDQSGAWVTLGSPRILCRD